MAELPYTILSALQSWLLKWYRSEKNWKVCFILRLRTENRSVQSRCFLVSLSLLSSFIGEIPRIEQALKLKHFFLDFFICISNCKLSFGTFILALMKWNKQVAFYVNTLKILYIICYHTFSFPNHYYSAGKLQKIYTLEVLVAMNTF